MSWLVGLAVGMMYIQQVNVQNSLPHCLPRCAPQCEGQSCGRLFSASSVLVSWGLNSGQQLPHLDCHLPDSSDCLLVVSSITLSSHLNIIVVGGTSPARCLSSCFTSNRVQFILDMGSFLRLGLGGKSRSFSEWFYILT